MNTPKPNGKVHRVAELFPMMAEEELEELAIDIKLNGQIHPIVLGDDGILIDGRNRLEACRRAAIQPQFVILANGTDPVLFILSQNINRRHLSKGQRAILVAKVRRLDSNQSTRIAARESGLSQSHVVQAGMILQFAPDLADAILAENGKFDPAYQIAKQRKEVTERNQANSARLQVEGPELWAKVQDDNDPMTLDAAIVELARSQRAAEEKKLEEAATRNQQRALSTQHLETALNYCEPHGYTSQEWAQRFLELFDPASVHEQITRKRIEQSAEVLSHLAKIWPTLYG